MIQLIDKAAVVEEITRRRDLHYKYYMKHGAGSIAECKYDEDREILSFLDTLEVKEVDLEKEIKDYIHKIPHSKTGTPDGWKYSWNEENVIEIAKHFFELGLNTQKEK